MTEVVRNFINKKDPMETKLKYFLSKALLVFVFFATTHAQAQTPQFYNYNTNGDGSNSFPLNQSSGHHVQLLYRVGDFNNPSPITPGYISSISIRIASSNPIGPWLYHNFTIKMGLTTLTDLPTTDFYNGPLTTVYFKDTVTLTGAADDWMTIPLDAPFYYDTTKSLVIDVYQTGIDGSVAGYSWCKTTGTGVRRTYSSYGAPDTFSNADSHIYHLGLNITKNDSCIRAINILPGTTTYGTTTGALTQNVPFCNTALNTSPGVWFKFTATGLKSTLNTCTGTSFDSKIGVFSGNCDSLICIGGNDDFCNMQSSVNICSQPGEEYYVYVTGFGGANGPFGLSLTSGISDPPYFISTPTTYIYPNAPQDCGSFAIVPVPEYFDDCTVSLINDYTGTNDASANYPIGTTYINWQLIDEDNQIVSNYQDTIIIIDTEAPILHCPADIIQPTDSGLCGAIVNYTPPTGLDNCQSVSNHFELHHSNTQNINSGIACNSMGATKHNRLAVTFDLNSLGVYGGLQTDSVDFGVYEATSVSGFQPIKINFYMLSGPMDTLNLTLIDSMTVQVPNCNDTILSYPFSTLLPTNEIIVYEIEIPDGTTNNNYFMMGVNNDGQLSPSYILASECSLNNFTNLEDISYSEAFVLNIHGTTSGGTDLISGIGSGNEYPVGTTTDVYISGDAFGNFSTCSVNITVVDEEAPSITTPSDVTLNSDSCIEHNIGCATQTGFAGAFDPYYWTFSQINANGSNILSHVPDTITITGGNNMSDDEGFTMAYIPINCNGNIVFSWNYNGADSALYDTPKYSIDGGNTYMLIPGFSTSGPINQTGTSNIAVQDGQTFAIGIYTLDNKYGAASMKLYDFSGPATPIPVFNDNCGIVSVSSNHPSSEFEVGETIVTWTVTDIHGNITNADQIITINENTNPVVICPSDIEITTTSSVGEIYLYDVTATDNCGVTNLIQTSGLASGSQFPNGATTNTWTATDASGNTGTCTFTVTVINVTSLGESGETAVNLYPNPASDVVYAEMPEGFEGTNVSLYNAEGALVRSYGACNEKLAEFDINGLTEGVYFMKFENQHTSFYKKVVKN